MHEFNTLLFVSRPEKIDQKGQWFLREINFTKFFVKLISRNFLHDSLFSVYHHKAVHRHSQIQKRLLHVQQRSHQMLLVQDKQRLLLPIIRILFYENLSTLDTCKYIILCYFSTTYNIENTIFRDIIDMNDTILMLKHIQQNNYMDTHILISISKCMNVQSGDRAEIINTQSWFFSAFAQLTTPQIDRIFIEGVFPHPLRCLLTAGVILMRIRE